MSTPNVFATLAAAVVAFIISGGYYTAFGSRLAQLSPAYAESGGMGVPAIGMELGRSLVVAIALGALVAGLEIESLAGGLLLALGLWVAFPVVLLVGSVIHESAPPMLAAIHAGDWLLKMAVVAGIVTLWR